MTEKTPAPSAVEGLHEFLSDLGRSRNKYPRNDRMFDGLMGEVDELVRAYNGDGDIRAEAFDVAVCAFRIATEGDAGGNSQLRPPEAGAGMVPVREYAALESKYLLTVAENNELHDKISSGAGMDAATLDSILVAREPNTASDKFWEGWYACREAMLAAVHECESSRRSK